MERSTCPEWERKQTLSRPSVKFVVVFRFSEKMTLIIGLIRTSTVLTWFRLRVPVTLKEVEKSMRFMVLLRVIITSSRWARGLLVPHRPMITRAVVGVAVVVTEFSATVEVTETTLGWTKRRTISVVLMRVAATMVRKTLIATVRSFTSLRAERWNLPLTMKVTKFSVIRATTDRSLIRLRALKLTLRPSRSRCFRKKGFSSRFVSRHDAIVGKRTVPVRCDTKRFATSVVER